MKLRFRDKAIVVVLLCSFAVYLVFNYIVVPADKEADKLKEKKEKVEALLSDIEPLLQETEKKKTQRKKASEKLEVIKSEKAFKTATSEEFLVFLGKNAEENNVKVTGFSDLGNTSEDGIYKAYYDIELSGTPFALTHVVEALDTMGINYSVGSVSFRQDKEYDYLKRFFDAYTNLAWYTEPEEEKKEEVKTGEASEGLPAEQAPSEQIKPPQTENIQPQPEQNKPIQKDEAVEAETVEPGDNKGFVMPDDNSIEDRLNELLRTSCFNRAYKVKPLTNTTVIAEAAYTDEMRLSFTICLTMFNEPSPETSFINIEEPEEDDEVF